MKKRLALLLALTGLVLSMSSPAATAAPSWCRPGADVVILGDSSATGYGATGYDPGDGRAYQPTRWGWPSMLERRLPRARVTNLALNGATASDFLPDGGVDPWPRLGPMQPSAVDRIKRNQPQLVIVALGGNEYASQRHPRHTYLRNLLDLRDRIRSASPASKLLFVHTWDFSFRYREPYLSGPAPDTYPWREYARQLRIVAARDAYLDLTQFMPRSDDGAGGLYTEDEMGDRRALHPTDAGQSLEFAAYWSKLTCG